MAVTTRRMSLPPEAVWAALNDGYSYGYWVVGTRDIRAVDDDFPAAGSKLHYTVGYGPLKKEDETVVLTAEPPRRLVLRAHAWPAGTAKITITVDRVDGGSSVAIDERPDQGLARTVENPLGDAAIKLRNVLTLRRLEKAARQRVSG